MSKKSRRYWLSLIAVFLLMIPPSVAYGTRSLLFPATDSLSDVKARNDWSRSNITIAALQNLTVIPSNLSLIEPPAQMNPVNLVIDTMRGFVPTQRFDSEFNSALARQAYVGNCSLRREDDGLQLFLNASSEDNAGIAAYNLSFTNPKQISKSDFISLALSTDANYSSNEAYIGVSLLLRDLQGNRRYVSIEVSDRYPRDSFGLSEWFLGWGFTEEFPKYPKYRMRYNSESGPWFTQLALFDSFDALNLSSAWLDGLLIGGEIYTTPPFNIEEITDVNATFHYVLTHEQPFMMNQEVVNSTEIVFPFTNSLSFSGIPGKQVHVSVEGLLKPDYDSEEQRENEATNIRETFFNLSRTLGSDIMVEGTIDIAVRSKAVKECLLTLNNNTIVDLTDELLDNSMIGYEFPEETLLLKLHLVLYRFNTWFCTSYGFELSGVSKRGIVEEYLLPAGNGGVVKINSSQASGDKLALGSGNLTPSEITINGIETLLESVVILNDQPYWIIPFGTPEENIETYTVKYVLSDDPIYESLTANPFPIYVHSCLFEIYTPFNIEEQVDRPIPFTIRTFTPRTHTLEIEYNPSMFEADKDEIMVYSSRFHFEYFMLKPLRTGQTTVNLRIVDPITGDTLFSSFFSVSLNSSVANQVALYFLLGVSVFSLFCVFSKKSLMNWISGLRSRATSS